MTNVGRRRQTLRFAIRMLAVALIAVGNSQPGESAPPDGPTGQVVELGAADDRAPPVEADTVASPDETQAQGLTPIRRTDGATPDSGERRRPSSLTSSLAVLGLVLGGAYFALNWLRRRQDTRSVQAQPIDLLASRRLDAHATLHLVRIGRQVLAVGSSSGGTRTLAVIDDPEEIAVLVSSSTGASAGESPVIRRVFQRRGAPNDERTANGSSAKTPEASSERSRRPA